MSFPYKLYLVTNEHACKGKSILEVVEAAVKGGVDIVQFRDKDLDDADFTAIAMSLQYLLAKYEVPLIINDRWDIAKELNSFGIHVGKSDNSPTIIKGEWPQCSCIGYSIEYEEQLDDMDAHNADYLGISPVFSTLTKTDTITEWGLEGIRWIRSKTEKPLVAIGNINMTNVADVIKAGADSIAVVSAICSAEDPERAAALLRNEIEKAKLT